MTNNEEYKENSSNPPQYDSIGESYIKSKEGFFTEHQDLGKEFIFDHLIDCEGKSVLDVGCGGGAEMALYRTKGFSRIVGIDPSPTMVAAARESLQDSGAEANVGSWETISYPDESFDYLIGRFSLHYVKDCDVAYREAGRVLRHGGYLMLVIPHPDADTNVVIENDIPYVRVSLYGGKVSITYPKHTLDQYFSPTFKELFEVVDTISYKSLERDDAVSERDTIAFLARRR